MNKLLKVFVITILVLCAFFVFAACNSTGITGKYYEEKSDGTFDTSSWIELKSGGKWIDDEGEAGTYKLDGQKITFYQDGEDLFDGTVVDGVLTIELFDTTVYRKSPAQNTDNNNGEGDDTNKEYNITLSQNIDAAGSITGGGKYIAGAERTITAETNEGYTWLGWYDNDTKVSTNAELTYSFTMPAESKTYQARWSVKSYTVTANKNIDNAGIITGDGSKEYGTNVILTATTNIGYTWLGWYDGDTKVSTDNELTYTFTMPSESKTFEARWVLTEQGDYDIDGYTQIGNYIWFGEYPQTIKAESVTIIGTQDDRGYYLGDDDYYYAKVVAEPFSSDYIFSTGAIVISDAVYYFKVEPIKWRILGESNGEALIICESIIANNRYDKSSNNYMNSEIRTWLNNAFYNAAFSGLQQALIKVTEVDNSEDSTGYTNNPYACDNTFDEIFLPSYREMVNSSYGFSSEYSDYDTARVRVTTDYSRATGVWLDNEIDFYGNGFWWLRSPTSSSYSHNARYINEYGYISSSYHVDSDFFGVVPALTIKLS